jgi:hypothetical protein
MSKRRAVFAAVGLPRVVDRRPPLRRRFGNLEQGAIAVANIAVDNSSVEARRGPTRVRGVRDLCTQHHANRHEAHAIEEQLEHFGFLLNLSPRLGNKAKSSNILHAPENRDVNRNLCFQHFKAREHIGLLQPDRNGNLPADGLERIFTLLRNTALGE